MRELMLEYLDFVDDVAGRAGQPRGDRLHPDACSSSGTGADRQLRVFARNGRPQEGGRLHGAETEAGYEPAGERARLTTTVRSGTDARARAMPSGSACACSPHETVTVITDRACAEIAAASCTRLDAGRRAATSAFVLEDLAPRPLVDCRRPSLDDMETQPGQHLRRRRRRRNELRIAHADDRRRQPPQDAARAHGEHQPRRSCSRACAPTSTKVDRSARRCSTIVATARADPRHDAGRHRHHGRPQPELPLAEDERHHQPRQVGQPARRRDLHHARAR